MTVCKLCGQDSATLAEVVRMRNDLEMQVAELEEALERERSLVPAGYQKLTPSEAILLSLLLTRGECSKAELLFAYRAEFPDRDPDPKIIDVMICKLRRKVAGVGITITTIWGKGYSIPREVAEPAIERFQEIAAA